MEKREDKRRAARAAEAEARWGHTDAWREYGEKSRGRTPEAEKALGEGLMAIFADLGAVKQGDPASPEAQTLVRRLQGYLTEHYYACTPELLRSLGELYDAGGEFTESIDAAGGPGTAAFARRAIEAYCG